MISSTIRVAEEITTTKGFMRGYFRAVAVKNGMLPSTVAFKSNGKIKTSEVSDERKRGSILPASGPLKACVLGSKPTHREGYARVIAFSIVSPSETCENSLMVTAQEAHTPAIELIFKLEPGLAEKIVSIVIYEAWKRKKDDAYCEKITIAPVSELLYPVKWLFARLKKELFSCVMCDNAEMLKEVTPDSLESYYAPSFYLYQGYEQIGMASPRLLAALQKGLEEYQGPLLSHVLINDGPATELRLNRDYFQPTLKKTEPELAEAI